MSDIVNWEEGKIKLNRGYQIYEFDFGFSLNQTEIICFGLSRGKIKSNRNYMLHFEKRKSQTKLQTSYLRTRFWFLFITELKLSTLICEKRRSNQIEPKLSASVWQEEKSNWNDQPVIRFKNSDFGFSLKQNRSYLLRFE